MLDRKFNLFHNLTLCVYLESNIRLNIIFVNRIKDMPYEEIYFQRLKEDNPEESEKQKS